MNELSRTLCNTDYLINMLSFEGLNHTLQYYMNLHELQLYNAEEQNVEKTPLNILTFKFCEKYQNLKCKLIKCQLSHVVELFILCFSLHFSPISKMEPIHFQIQMTIHFGSMWAIADLWYAYT